MKDFIPPCIQPGCDGNGTYAETDEDGDAVPAQCQYCYEVRFPLMDKLEEGE